MIRGHLGEKLAELSAHLDRMLRLGKLGVDQVRDVGWLRFGGRFQRRGQFGRQFGGQRFAALDWRGSVT